MLCQIYSCATFSHVPNYWKLWNYPQKKILNPQEKILDPQITYEKKFVPIKYPQENIFDPQNTHKKNLGPTK